MTTPLGHDRRPPPGGPSRFEILALLRIDMLAVLRRGQVYRAREVFQLVRDQWGHVFERRLWRCLTYLCGLGWVEHVPDGAAVPRHVDSAYRVTRAGRLVRERLLLVGDVAGSGIATLRIFSRSGASRRLCSSPGRWTYLRGLSSSPLVGDVVWPSGDSLFQARVTSCARRSIPEGSR